MTRPSVITSAWRSCSAAADWIGRWLIISGIHFYRRCLRDALGRECLFSVTCSELVLRAARDAGTRAAWRAFLTRVRSCRDDYSIGSEAGIPFALSRDGIRMPLEELIPDVQRELLQAQADARAATLR